MKDNLNEVVEYSIDSTQSDPKVRRQAMVTAYSPDGAIVYLENRLEGGGVEKLQLPVGVFLVHRILEKGGAQDELVNAGLAAAPAPVPAGEAEDRDSRRLSESPITPEKRRTMGKKAPVDHGTAAAQPDEFAEPKDN